MLSSIGGSAKISMRIEDIENDISELKLEERALKILRDNEDYSVRDRFEIGRQIAGIGERITALTLQITALTNKEVELMKEKALAGMARNYLSQPSILIS